MANLTTNSQTFKVTGFDLGDFGIDVMLKNDSCEVKHLIIKDQFEEWLTNGTGEVEYALPELNGDNDLTGRMGTMPLEAYWQETEAVIMSDLYGYLTEKQIKEVVAAFLLEKSLSEIKYMIGLAPHQAAAIRLMMYQYGTARVGAAIPSFSQLLKTA